MTPMDKFFELINKTPYWEEVEADHGQSVERLQEQNYRLDLQLKRLKPSV
jgi:hypothetical protein